MGAVLILLVVFGVIGFVTYRDQQRQRQQPPLPGPVASPVLPDPVAPAPAEPVTESLLLALPEPARRHAWELLCLVHDGLSESSSADTRTRFLLAQTRQSYLPDTLRAYLHLTDGARRQLTAQGQSPEQLLDEQLALMTDGVHEALRRDHAAADRLLTQGRFLRERFGAGAEELRVRK
ncbi:hypothetical protein [Deinococcus sp. PESE-13]